MRTGHHTLALGPHEHGWLPLTLATGLYSLDIHVSGVLNDPVEELLEAALGCLSPRIDTIVMLWLEPDGYTLEVDPYARSVRLRFSYARELCAPVVPPDAQTEHECVVDSRSWASAIANGMREWDPVGWSSNPDRHHARLAELNRRLEEQSRT
jgi:hypothetical protein